MNFNLALRLAVKAMNDTMGPNGLVPSYLVFGILPRHPMLNSNLPLQSERMQIIGTAKAEMASIVAELRIKQALSSKPPAAASIVHQAGDMIRIYREGDKRMIGPYRVIRVNEKEVYVDQDGRLAHYKATQIIPTHTPTPDPTGDEPILKINDHLARFRSPRRITIATEDTNHTITDATKTISIDNLLTNQSQYNPNSAPDTILQRPPYSGPTTHSRSQQLDTPRILITEVLQPRDPRCADSKFATAKTKEIEGLIKKGTWSLVLRDELPDNANILGSRLVLTLKDTEKEQPIFKARFVVQGHKDKEKSR